MQKINRLGLTITAMIAMIAMIMTSTMVNVAIPNIMGAFGVGQDQAHWISTGFLSTMTAGMLLNGWLVAKFGPRNIFIGTLTFFSIAGVLGQHVSSFEAAVLARFAQGLCAGIIQPLALSTVYLAYPPAQRGVAMGWFGLGIVFGPTIGPFLGGLIIDQFEWRLLFSATVPIMVVAAFMASIFMPGRDPNTKPVSLNVISFILIITSIMLLLNGISIGQQNGWNTDSVFLMLFGAIVALIIFLFRELKSHSPLLQLRLFNYRNYVASALIAFIFGAGSFGSLYIIPVLVQTIQGFSAFKAGLMLLPGGIVSMIVFPIAGRLSTAVDPSHTIAVGLAIFGLSCWLLADIGMLTGFWVIALLVAFGRVGLGLVQPSLDLSSMNSVPRDLVPYAAGTLNFIRFTGASIGVSVLAIIIDYRTIGNGADLLTTQTPDNASSVATLRMISEKLSHLGLNANEGSLAAMSYFKALLSLKAQELAFQEGHIALCILFMLGVIATTLLFRRKSNI